MPRKTKPTSKRTATAKRRPARAAAREVGRTGRMNPGVHATFGPHDSVIETIASQLRRSGINLRGVGLVHWGTDTLKVNKGLNGALITYNSGTDLYDVKPYHVAVYDRDKTPGDSMVDWGDPVNGVDVEQLREVVESALGSHANPAASPGRYAEAAYMGEVPYSSYLWMAANYPLESVPDAHVKFHPAGGGIHGRTEDQVRADVRSASGTGTEHGYARIDSPHGHGWVVAPLEAFEQAARYANPAASPEQYRLAQAVLSGTARGHMSPAAAREIVDRTPAGLRSEYSRRNPKMYTSADLAQTIPSYARVAHVAGHIYLRPRSNLKPLTSAQENSLEVFASDYGFDTTRRGADEVMIKPGYGFRLFEARERNPADGAAGADEMYSTFHGSDPTETVVVDEVIVHHGDVSALGDLEELVVVTPRGHKVVLDFTADPPLLCSSSDGKQLLLRGGDMSIDLAAIKMNGDEWVKDVMVLGDVLSVTYRTAKTMDSGKVLSYEHKFTDPEGTKGGDRAYPVLTYDTLNNLLSFAGGTAVNLEAGIVG